MSCESCKHWDKDGGAVSMPPEGFGQCSLISGYHNPEPGITAIVAFGYDLFTRPESIALYTRAKMEPFKIKPRIGPEAQAQERILRRLRMDGWYCIETHGNEFQSGFPDIFACHSSYGSRWIEVKQPTGYKIKPSQHETFREFSKRNIGVWILTDDKNWEMNKLFQPPNWHTYLEVMKHINRASKPIEKAKEPRKQPDGPERRIQDAIKAVLEKEDWYCKDTHGSIFQFGFPDLYVCHARYGARWIECKNPTGYSFTPAQMKTFPQFTAQGVGVWVLTDKSEVTKLFQPANWWQYLTVMRS